MNIYRPRKRVQIGRGVEQKKNNKIVKSSKKRKAG